MPIITPSANLLSTSPQYATIYGPGVARIDVLFNQDAKRSGGFDWVVSLRLRNKTTASPSRVKIYWSAGPGYAAGNGGTNEITVYGNDSNNLPAMSGTVYGSANYSPSSNGMTNGSYPGGAQSFQEVTLSNTSAIPANTLFHVFVRNTASDPTNNWSSVDCLATIAQNGRSNPWLNPTDWGVVQGRRTAGTSGAYTWTEKSINSTVDSTGTAVFFAPVLQVTMSDGTILGHSPMETGNIVRSSGGVTTLTSGQGARERFTNPSALVVQGASIFCSAMSAGSAVVNLKNSSGTVLATRTITRSSANGSNYSYGSINTPVHAWENIDFGSNINVPAGVCDLEFMVQSGTWRIGSFRNGSSYGFVYPAAFTRSQSQVYNGSSWLHTNIWGSPTSSANNENWPVVLQLYSADAGGGTPPTTPLTPSPDNTVITTTAQQIVDSGSNVWKISSSGGITRNDAAPTNPDYTANVTLMLYFNGNIYHQNTTGEWYLYNTTVSPVAWSGPLTNGDPRSTTPTTSNGDIVPAAFKKQIADLVRTTAAGSKATAALAAIRTSIGSNYRLKIAYGSTTVVDLVFPASQVTVTGKSITLPLSYALLEQIQTMNTTGQVGTLTISSTDNRYGISGSIGRSGTDFLIGNDLSSSGAVYFTSALTFNLNVPNDTAPTDPGTNPGTGTNNPLTSIIIGYSGDSRLKGSGSNESTYVSCRGYVQRNLQNAGISVTVLGNNGNDNAVRLGSAYSPRSSAQGGLQLTGTTSITSYLNQFVLDNPRSNYNGMVLIMGGGANDAFASLSGTQIAANWSSALDNALSKLPGAIILCLGLEPGNNSFSESLATPVTTMLQGRDTGANSRVWFLDLRAAASWPSSMFAGDVHFSDAGAQQEAGLIVPFIQQRWRESTFVSGGFSGGTTNPGTNPGTGAETGSSTTRALLIAQQTAHEVWPFVANPGIQYAVAPYKIASQTVGVENFSLMGSACMPPGFNPGNKSTLNNTWFGNLVPWFVVAARRTAQGTNTNANSDTDAAIRIMEMQILIWRGGNNWDAPVNGATQWVGSYYYDFTTFQNGAASKYDGSALICRPSTNGLQVPHGGGSGISSVSNPSTVRGVVYRILMRGCSYANPTSYKDVMLTAYCGVDATPVGGSANSSFQPLNYAPGLGCSSFIRITAAPRYCTFTTMSAAQINANPPPGYP